MLSIDARYRIEFEELFANTLIRKYIKNEQNNHNQQQKIAHDDEQQLTVEKWKSWY